jgi:hypothetical protein
MLTAGTYPANAYSNKRWCCNDMDHFDVSAVVEQQLWSIDGALSCVQLACQLLLQCHFNCQHSTDFVVMLPARSKPRLS